MFNNLRPEDLERILDLQLAQVAARLAAKKIRLEVTPEAKSLIAEQGYDRQFGARPLKRLVQRLLQDPLAMAILEGRFGEGDLVRAERAGEGLRFGQAEAAAGA